MLISSLWMFVILGLIKNSEEDDIEDIFRQLPLVERCLYANLEEEQINTILVNFSIHILIYYLPLIIGKEKTEKFNNYCIQEYIDIYKLQDDSTIQKSKRKRRIESRLALMEETDLSADEKNKRDDCDTCERHGESKSNNCVRGTCRPDGYRKGRVVHSVKMDLAVNMVESVVQKLVEMVYVLRILIHIKQLFVIDNRINFIYMYIKL